METCKHETQTCCHKPSCPGIRLQSNKLCSLVLRNLCSIPLFNVRYTTFWLDSTEPTLEWRSSL